MRRKQKPLVNLLFFAAVLFAILFLNHSHSPEKAFAWTRIRYKSSAASLPPARGICPGLSPAKPALVVARIHADVDPEWLNTISDRYHLCVYTADAPEDSGSVDLQVPANRGHEAMAFLTFIIDNYDTIPAAGAVFVHGSRFSWHNDSPDYDNLALLQSLNISAALAPVGYHNLRCDWSASTCEQSKAPPQGSLETSFRAVLQPYDPRVISDSALPRSLAVLFGGDAPEAATTGGEVFLGRGDAVRSQCCAQFVVARENIRRHTRDEYIALRQWLLDGAPSHLNPRQRTLNKNAAPRDDRVAGRIVSYLWHILFIQQTVSADQGRDASTIDLQQLNHLACPRADDCYCRLYGRCNLPGCGTPGRCAGQYRIPPDFKLPADWAASHA
ncbi:hypothetical protein A1O7_06668 [Cladophialophora yegresii CBS 114405]|uniref:Uncharacterized protein n=1 Tax=Cladophialophora yegresii CBS 114405 TaxID=1182544 RepID=W9W3X4_9EURO|nr:uncharacterized protein A1O7_06668 [Cladophialophora yegresii CBS 114405]EXJ59236.1 hypothetical protein A1O7_06668 [Cladophialophora yegresii CBS 114405]